MTVLILVAALLVVVLAAVAFIINRLKIAGVSQAIIVSGARQNGEVKVISPGGKTFVWPVIQKASSLSLLQRKVELNVEGLDQNNIPITVRAVAMIKVGSTPELIRAAAERFTNQEQDIVLNAQEVLLGALRAIMGQMTVVDLVGKRDVLAANVTKNANTELEIIGLNLDSLQVSEITDKGDYIKNLGVPEAENASRQARIARANANREANDAEVAAKQAIAEKNRELAVRSAELKAETDKADAISAASGPLAKAERDAEIAKLNQATAEQQATLRERQLDSEVRKPADAALYQTQKDAEADKARNIAEAEAQAEGVRLLGEAEATATTLRGEAEAAALTARAEALKLFNEAAVTELLINKLPEIARELAAPMSNIDDLTIISTDGAGALPKAVAGNFGQLQAMVKSFTGKDLSEMIGGSLDAATSVRSEEENTPQA